MLRNCTLGLSVLLLMTATSSADLLHQYTFNDGTADDSVGDMHGTIVNPTGAVVSLGGHLDMRVNDGFGSNQEGGTGDFTRFVDGVYVDLPNFMISDIAIESGNIISLEAWVTVETDRTWQRIFDFGTSQMGEDTAVSGQPTDYLFLTSNNGGNLVEFTTHFGSTDANGVVLGGPERSTTSQHHYVSVFDQTDTSVGANGSMFLYVDGQPAGEAAVPDGFFLDFVFDENNWLGRSQWNDPLFDGTYNEFRVYDHALSEQEAADSFDTGPEAVNPRFVINRDDQTITIESHGLDGDLAGYSLTSASGALNVGQWTPITGNLDDGTFDDDAWAIDLSSTGEAGESATAGTGGEITDATSISLGSIWFASPSEDIAAQVQLEDGSIVGAEVVFEGNNGLPFIRSDLNFDGSVNADDWPVYVANLFGDFSDLSPAEAYTLGDLNGDLINNVRDYQLFQADFIAANGAEAFAALGAGIVPEPSTVVIALLLGVLVCSRRLFVAVASHQRRLFSTDSIWKLLFVAVALAVVASPASAQLVHRWSFNEEGGTVIEDSVGDADAELIGGGFLTGGFVELEGGASATASYVDLPNGIISRLHNATFEGWAIVDGAQNWGRLFDFGSSLVDGAGGEVFDVGGGGEGQDYLELSAFRGGDVNLQRLEFRNLDPAFLGSDAGNVTNVTQLQDTGIPTTIGEEFHFAVIFDSDADQMSQYRNGRLVATTPVTFELGNLNDVNNWLGRSNWTNDANLQGRFNEFRIYDTALDDFEIGTSFVGGPDVGEDGPPVLELEVDRGTGQVTLHNRQADPIDLQFYEVQSPAGALNVDGWSSLDEQDIDSIGSNPGESWDEGGASNANQFGEAFLLGSSSLGAGTSINLGTAFSPGGGEDLNFRYLRADGLGIVGNVTYVGDEPTGIPGDYDGDLFVGQGDIDLVLLNWGEDVSGGPPAGWTTNLPTGSVDQNELDDVLLNWGRTAAAVNSAAVPEPSSWLLVASVLCFLAAMRSSAKTARG